jgi:hypothetical protein
MNETEYLELRCSCHGRNKYTGLLLGNNILVTPNLFAYKHELIHFNGYEGNGNPAMVCQ